MSRPKPMKIPKITQLPSGAYFCRIRINGQDVSISDYDYNVVEAKAYACKAGLTEIRKHPLEITLAGACRRFIEENKILWSPSTLQGYEKIVRVHFTELMSVKLVNITSERLRRAVRIELQRPSRRGGTLSVKTVKTAYMFVCEVLRYNNVKVDTRYRFPEPKEYVPIIAEPSVIYEAVKGTEIELPVLLAMWFSFTMSEIRGLTKSKSLRGDLLVIEETVVDIGGKPVRKSGGKERRRTRAHRIPPYIRKLIDAVDGDVIVPMSGQALGKRFTRLMAQNGIDRMSFHKLRHVNASVMARLNLPTNIAMERGGWSTESTMRRVYTHTFTADRIAADNKIDAYFDAVISDNEAKKMTME